MGIQQNQTILLQKNTTSGRLRTFPTDKALTKKSSRFKLAEHIKTQTTVSEISQFDTEVRPSRSTDIRTVSRTVRYVYLNH